MDLSLLADYVVPLIFCICLCFGYILKNAIPTDKINGYIPLIVAAIGVAMNIWANDMSFTPKILLEGMASGLASTGGYELFKNISTEIKTKIKG